MKSLVIYDSNFGNTQKVAEVIARILGAKAVKISAIQPSELTHYELLVVGTPIIGWRPTADMQAFLQQLPNLSGLKIATFDTRVKLFIHGDAMGKVAASLKKCGAEVVIPSMPFYVAGPQQAPYLLAGEVEKAEEWARAISLKLKKNDL